jgi:hypothetical protein
MTDATCPACGGPPRTFWGHDDETCPLTRIPGRVQRGGRLPRRGRPDCVVVPLDEADPWDTGGSLVHVDGWPIR